MSDQSTLDNHPISKLVLEQRKEKLAAVLEHRTTQITIVLDGVRNYHNIAAVMRSADAFGINSVHMVGDSFEYSSGISKGAEQWLNLKNHRSSQDALHELRNLGYKIVILQAESKKEESGPISKPIFELDFNDKLAFVFGNEYQGISKTFQESADLHCFIPMYGFVESLNISVTAAIVMFCSLFKPGALRGKLPLTEAEQKDTLDRWLENSIRGGSSILKAVDK